VIATKRARPASDSVSVVIATAESVSTVAIAVVAAPTIPRCVETTIPAKTEGARDTKVGIRPPAPDPRRSQPRPAIAGVVDIGIGRSVVGRSFVGILISVGHPNPPVLFGVDPLAAIRRLMSHHHGLLNLRSRLRLDWRGWRLHGWCWGLLPRSRRGRLHLLGLPNRLRMGHRARRAFSGISRALIGSRNTESQEQETHAGSQLDLHGTTSYVSTTKQPLCRGD
jgi:hypothetical protein